MSSRTLLLAVAALAVAPLLTCSASAAQASDVLLWSQPAIPTAGGKSPMPIYSGRSLPSNDWFDIAMVDDFACPDSRPVTGIVFWGSYATSGSDGCRPRVAEPTFSFSIFAGSPTGPPVWSYQTDDFTQQLAGTVSDPRAVNAGRGSVVRYTVTLPEENWFQRPCGDETYWLSIKTISDKSYPTWWGWLSRPHTWGDDARTATVSDYWWKNVPSSHLRNSDMAFELLTVPEPAGLIALGSALMAMSFGLRLSRGRAS